MLALSIINTTTNNNNTRSTIRRFYCYVTSTVRSSLYSLEAISKYHARKRIGQTMQSVRCSNQCCI